MDNKLSELSKPVSYIADCGTVVSDSDPFFDDYKNPKPIYSQEYVSALQHESAVNWEAAASLNVENQELKKRIAELEGQLQSGFTPEALAQEERAENAEQRVAELEARLATPVRLPDVMFIKVRGKAVPVMHADRVDERVRAAGFTVEGDE
jgi:BMFP domain-containing protein YqiC